MYLLFSPIGLKIDITALNESYKKGQQVWGKRQKHNSLGSSNIIIWKIS